MGSAFRKAAALYCRGVAYQIILSNFIRFVTVSWDCAKGHTGINSRARIRSPSGTYFVSDPELRRLGEGALSTQNLGTLDVQFSVSNIASPARVERRLSSEAYRNQARVCTGHEAWLQYGSSLRSEPTESALLRVHGSE